MRQRRGAFRIDPEPRREVFIISKPQRGLPRRGETPLSGGLHFRVKTMAQGGLFDNGEGGAMRAPGLQC